METKELILKVSLDLFSRKGFNAATVRDIAAMVGIKDSSLYFHFKNKQTIMDSLMSNFISISEQMMSFLDHAVTNITSMNDEQFLGVTENQIQKYFFDSFISKFIMIMNHERSHNAKIREQYNYWCIKKPIEYQISIFEKLQKIGYLKMINPQHLALEYYAPIFLYFNLYINHDCTCEDKKAFEESVMNAAKRFLVNYKEENGNVRNNYKEENGSI